MDKKPDIYSAPESGEDKDKQLPVVDLQSATARDRARRKTWFSSIVMLVVLGLSLWLFVWWEEGSDERLQERRDSEFAFPPGEDYPDNLPPPLLVSPEVEALTEQLTSPRGAALTGADRERIGQAMGHIRIANQYLREREWDQAEQHAKKSLEIWPDMIPAMRMLGFIYTQRGQFNQAVAILENVLEREPFSGETFNNLASVYIQKWELDRAEELLITALEINPQFAVAHMNLGLLNVINGRYDLTIEHLEEALTLVPESLPARNNLAVALLRVGRYDEAREHLNRIIERQPTRASAYFNIAITYVLERNAPEAMGWIQKGAQYCSPVTCRSFLGDSDFDPLRGHPSFQGFLKNLYPELPSLPEG